MLALTKSFERNQRNLCSNLRFLSLAGNSLESPLVCKLLGKILSGCSSLKELKLSNTNLVFSSFGELRSTNLTMLDVSGNIITEEKAADFLEFLKRLPGLQKLNLSNCGLTPEVLRVIGPELKRMETLDFSDNNLGDPGVIVLLELLQGTSDI